MTVSLTVYEIFSVKV